MSTGKVNDIKGKLLMMPLRLALTGKKAGPDISKVIEIFGKEKTLLRLGELND
jgi:glutamyl/glutaminyl-tRNA synthetase